MRRFFVPGGKWTQWSTSSSTAITGPEKPFSAMRGGMLSGRAASRTGQLLDTASQHTFGGWQGGHRPRWQYTSPRLEIITPAIGDGRPT